MSADAGAKKEKDLTSLFAGNLSELSFFTVLQSKIGFFRLFVSLRVLALRTPSLTSPDAKLMQCCYPHHPHSRLRR